MEEMQKRFIIVLDLSRVRHQSFVRNCCGNYLNIWPVTGIVRVCSLPAIFEAIHVDVDKTNRIFVRFLGIINEENAKGATPPRNGRWEHDAAVDGALSGR